MADPTMTEYVNYLDIKLEGVHHLPADWLSSGFPAAPIGGGGGGVVANNAANGGSGHTHGKDAGVTEGPEVAYAYHPFRYEVSLAMPASVVNIGTGAANVEGETLSSPTADAGTGCAPPSPSSKTAIIASFTRGRLLQPLPQYTAYIAAAEPPPAPGLDDASPLRDVPVAIGAEAATGDDSEAAVAAAGVDSKEPHPTAVVEDSASALAVGATAAILWVMTEKTDSPGITSGDTTANNGLLTTKRRVRSNTAPGSSNGAGAGATTSALNLAAAAAAAAVPGAPAPPLPDSTEAPPCVLRVPLTAAQEAYLDGLLEAGAPLVLNFRRVLRPNCPPEWEDFNAEYFEGEIGIPLQALTEPGSTCLSAQVDLHPAHVSEKRTTVPGVPPADIAEITERGKKRSVTRKQRQTVPSTLIDAPDRDAPHPYVSAGTTAIVSLSLQHTLTRLASDRVRPAVTPAQLIPPRPTPMVAAAAAGDVHTRLQNALREIVLRLVKDMRGAVKSVTGGEGGADSAAWRVEFVSALQSSGELAAFKSQLAPLVTALVQERLRCDPTDVGSQQEVARATNELYVQLMDMLHSSLHECVHGGDAAAMPTAVKTLNTAKADEALELRWRAVEAEVSGDVELASKLYQSRLAMNVEGHKWASLWVDCAHFYQRTEDLAKAEQCYREAIACDPNCTAALLDYGTWLLAHDRLDEAAVFLHGLVDVVPQHKLGWGCIALLADLHELAIRVGNPNAVVEQKKWRREHRLAMRKAVEPGLVASTSEIGGDAGPSRLSDAATAGQPSQQLQDGEEEVFLKIATYLVNLHHRDLANVCLARCRPRETRVELLYARLFTQGGQYEEALRTLEEMDGPSGSYVSSSEATKRLMDELALLRAECVAHLGQRTEAIMLYKRALCHGEPAAAPPYLPAVAARWNAQSRAPGGPSATRTTGTAEALLEQRQTEKDGMQYLDGYLRLCNLLLAEGRYRDALGVATIALQVWPNSSVLWLGTGIAYYRAGDLVPAEECLQESNTLNPSNPRTWAYLALLAVRLQNVGVEEVVQQLLSLNLEDAPLWAELGRTLLNTAKYPQLSVLCLRRAAALAKGREGDAMDAFQSSTQYHLAHALMDLQQWGEAGQLLESVVAHSGSNEVLRGKAEEELVMLRTGA